jgi:PAS domain S-box-containing protein
VEALIDLFWSKYGRLQTAIDREDNVTIHALDQEIDPLLQAIFRHEVTDAAGIQAQFRFALELLKTEADDRGCVHRNGHLLQMLVERYLAPQIGRAAGEIPGKRSDHTESSEGGNTINGLLDPALFDGIAERILVVVPGYRVFYSNETNARQLGLSKEKVIGKHFAELIGIHHFQCDLREPLDRCLAGESVSLTYAEERDGDTVVISCRMSPCFTEARAQVGAMVVMQEMADRRRRRSVG